MSAWTVDDLIVVIDHQFDPLALQALFAAGMAGDLIPDALWERDHGATKRIRTIARYIAEVGWTQQVAAQRAGPPADAPLLTIDAAMMLVDARLQKEGATRNCTRADVEAAITWLTHPLIACAEPVPATGTNPQGIVIKRPTLVSVSTY